MKLAGDLACQNDSYQKTLTTQVVSCREVEKDEADWVKNAVAPASGAAPEKWWVVQLEDTVLFPEGGGQPFDIGKIGEAFCGNVQRKDLGAFHLVDRQLEVGTDVDVNISWERRFDHMQQHSGQHLLSAMAEKHMGLDTMCWGMGTDMSYVQLPVGTLTKEAIQQVEDACNEKIRAAEPIKMTQIPPSAPEASGDEAKSVPSSAGGGMIRMIDLTGVENSPCCGTHVAHMGQLQCIKLLHTETKANTIRLFFVVGNRVQKLLASAYDRERAIMKLLGTNPGDFEASIARMQKTMASQKKLHQAALKDLSALLGESLAENLKANDVGLRLSYHRDDADMPFLQVVAEKITKKDKSVLATLSQGEKGKGGEGQMLITCGDEERFKAAVAKAEEILKAKGGVNRGAWRGKVPNLKLLKDFDKLVL